jgi:hypothetical protein
LRTLASSRVAISSPMISAASGRTLHFAPSDRPSAIPATPSRQRRAMGGTARGKAVAAASIHSESIAMPAITISSMAMRLWISHAKSLPSRIMPAMAAKRWPLAHHIIRPKAKSPSTPIQALGRRHAKGVSPKRAIDQAISVLAKSGCSGLARVPSSMALAAAT